MSDTADVRCWSCDVPLDPFSIERDGYLVPRHASEGGPLRLLRCPRCGTENGAERNRAGEFLLVPVTDPGVSGWVASLFDAEGTAVRARALAWWRLNRKLRRAFHDTPARPWARPADEPPDDSPADDTPPPPDEGPPPGSKDTPGREAAPDPILEHYRTLDAPLTATRDDIAAAYRRLSQRCHPDKVAHLDEEFQVLAEKKFRRLSEAYEALMDALA